MYFLELGNLTTVFTGQISQCAGTRRFGASPNKPPQATAKHAPRVSNLWSQRTILLTAVMKKYSDPDDCSDD
ncbi:MAG: hypothetical protein U1E51_19035 [Candidatus Binatia bacterium]|nr:hypothetical protein [Candidatus Binatia bacterium]